MNAHPTDEVVSKEWEGNRSAYVIRSDHWGLYRVELWIDGDLDEATTSWHDTLKKANRVMYALFD